LELLLVGSQSFITDEADALRVLFGSGSDESVAAKVEVQQIARRLATLFATTKVRPSSQCSVLPAITRMVLLEPIQRRTLSCFPSAQIYDLLGGVLEHSAALHKASVVVVLARQRFATLSPGDALFETRIPSMAAKYGRNVPFCMPNRTKCIPSVSGHACRADPQTARQDRCFARQEYPSIRFRAAKPPDVNGTPVLDARSLVCQRIAVELDALLSNMKANAILPASAVWTRVQGAMQCTGLGAFGFVTTILQRKREVPG
jgi:hypothetical protein